MSTKFLSIADSFCEFLFEIGKIRQNEKFEKLEVVQLGPKLVFLKYEMSHLRLKVSSEWPKHWENRIFKFFFTFFGSFLFNFWTCSSHKIVVKTQELLIRVSSVGNFEEVTKFWVGIGIKYTQKAMKQQKSTLFDKWIAITVQTTKIFDE